MTRPWGQAKDDDADGVLDTLFWWREWQSGCVAGCLKFEKGIKL